MLCLKRRRELISLKDASKYSIQSSKLVTINQTEFDF